MGESIRDLTSSGEVQHPGGAKLGQVVMWMLLSAVVVATLVMGSVPPVSRDALTHHLAVPKLYLKHGGIYETPSLFFSYYPMNIDLLYLVPLYLNFDIGAKYIHYLFALMTAWFIFRYLNKYAGKQYGLFGAIAFLTIPVILKLSITVYVDLGLVFFSWLSLYFFLIWCAEGFQTRNLLFSATSCGLALGTKYNAMILLIIMAAMVPLGYSIRCNRGLSSDKTAERYRNSLQGIKWCMLFVTISLVIFSPWMIKNYRWTGNPVYPLYDNVINPQKAGSSAKKMSVFERRRLVYGESFLQTLTIPIRIFFQGRDDDPKYFDGSLNPFLFILPLLALWRRRENPEFRFQLQILLAFSILFIVMVWLTSDMRIRYMAPAIPPLIILLVVSIRNIADGFNFSMRYRRVSITLAVLIGAAAIGYNISYAGKLFTVVDPFAYLSGEVDRDAYITKFRAEYPVIQYANRHLPEDARVLCLMIGNRSYYLERDFQLSDLLFSQYDQGQNLSDMLSELIHDEGIDYIILGKNTYLRWANSVLGQKERAELNAYFRDNMNLIYQKWGYELLSVKLDRHSKGDSL